jgi:hypothetical protein
MREGITAVALAGHCQINEKGYDLAALEPDDFAVELEAWRPKETERQFMHSSTAHRL